MKHVLFFILFTTGFIYSSEECSALKTIELAVTATNRSGKAFKWGWHPAPSSAIVMENAQKTRWRTAQVEGFIETMNASFHRDRQRLIQNGEKQTIESSTTIPAYATVFEFFVTTGEKSQKLKINLADGKSQYRKKLNFNPPKKR